MQNSLFVKKITPLDPTKSPRSNNQNEDFLILPEITS